MNKLNIQSLLSDYSFVVPEIQREYVWGNKNSRNDHVLRQFLKDLNEKATNGETNIGFYWCPLKKSSPFRNVCFVGQPMCWTY